MTATRSRIGRVMQYFRDVDLDEAEVAFTLVSKIVVERLQERHAKIAKQKDLFDTPRKGRGKSKKATQSNQLNADDATRAKNAQAPDQDQEVYGGESLANA